MFERPHHQRIARVLRDLDAGMLEQLQCWFGGGTAIVLRFGEYRESVDLDFMVSDISAYRQLRRQLAGRSDIAPLQREGSVAIRSRRELRADQYGIRTTLDIAGVPIKFEIVLEGRIRFEQPSPGDRVCGVATLSTTDLAASKLLANSDRWRDDSVFSRDAIDLAMMDLSPRRLRPALDKAGEAYGEAVNIDMQRAVAGLRERSGHLQRCIDALSIELPAAAVLQHLRKLERRLDAAAKEGLT